MGFLQILFVHLLKCSYVFLLVQAAVTNISSSKVKVQADPVSAFCILSCWRTELRKEALVSLFFFKLIYLFLAALGLRFCARAFSSCGKRGPLFIAVRGPLTIPASLAAEHRLQTRRLSSCGSRAQLPHGMWDLPGPGLKPVSPALAGRLSTTAPPGKPWCLFL